MGICTVSDPLSYNQYKRGHPLKGPVKRKKIFIAKKGIFLQGYTGHQGTNLFSLSASGLFMTVLANSYRDTAGPE
jgi:hypothetical protein